MSWNPLEMLRKRHVAFAAYYVLCILIAILANVTHLMVPGATPLLLFALLAIGWPSINILYLGWKKKNNKQVD